MIRWTYAFVDRPAARFDRACEFWTAATATKLSPPRGAAEEFVTLLPSFGDAYVKAQAVGDSGGAHLDLCVDDVVALIRAATGLGATTVSVHEEYTVLRSPGGQLFCAVPWNGERQRPPVSEHADLHAGLGTRLDQVCVDLAPAVFDDEVVFWSALTGWDSVPGSRPEFHVVRPPETLPIRILLQRLESDRATGAHLDIACQDVTAARRWHERLGASFVADGARWTVMRDPAGGTYCLTGRDPWTGGLPGRT